MEDRFGVAILQGLNHLLGVVPDCILIELDSVIGYFVLHFGKKAFLVCVLEDHAEGVVVSEAAEHLEDVGMVHE